MKLVEVANRCLTRRQFECWYQRRIENIEPEEVARRMNVSVHRVHSLVWEATRELADHVDEIEDVDLHLSFMVSILRGHKVENAVDSTVKSVVLHEKRDKSVNST
jgi:hypothetical protein